MPEMIRDPALLRPQPTPGPLLVQEIAGGVFYFLRKLRQIDGQSASLDLIAKVETKADAQLFACAAELLAVAEDLLPYLDLMWPPEAPMNIRVQLRDRLHTICKEARRDG